MHMADALVSPAVGGAMWAAAAGLTTYSARRLSDSADDARIPLMGVLGAFVFAAQMIYFSIPGTGSSGHLGGGLLLAVLLGPHPAFLTMASILAIQALFFADGGLLAFGCNLFNLGFFPCYIAYPFVFRRIAGTNPSRGRLTAALVAASVVGLQFGALSVVAETWASGLADLPFVAFLMLMQPVHFVIALVEGAVTAAVVAFIWRERPDLANADAHPSPMKGLLTAVLIAALLVGGVFSWFASPDPDGLEWSLSRAAVELDAARPAGIHALLAEWQEKMAIFPDYRLKTELPADGAGAASEKSAWPAVDAGTSAAGVAGSLITLVIVFAVAALLRRLSRLRSPA